MSIFTKVPGIYRTREGGYAYVKYIHNGTDYPVIGCKAQLMPDNTVQWVPNIMQAYTLEGRCMIGKDQAEDIVAYDSARVVLIFRLMKGTPPPADIGKQVLFRLPPYEGDFVEYKVGPYQEWMHAPDNYPVEWAELPTT